MTQHTLMLDNVVYWMRSLSDSKIQWSSVLGPLGPVFNSEAEALNWIELMLKYELQGRGQVFLKCTKRMAL